MSITAETAGGLVDFIEGHYVATYSKEARAAFVIKLEPLAVVDAVKGLEAACDEEKYLPNWATLRRYIAASKAFREHNEEEIYRQNARKSAAPSGYATRAREYIDWMREHAHENPEDGSWGQRAVDKLHREFRCPTGCSDQGHGHA